ncbi:MAG: NifU family protein, partial [Rhodospirillaceae bacterium]|nr:NifU family protein [Rhodospirillaceae bacterium]
MFIQTEPTPNPATLKFLPGRPVMESGVADFTAAEDAQQSPLARRLFELDGVTGVFFGTDFVTVTKTDDMDWQVIKPLVLGAIMDHYTSGQPLLLDGAAGNDENDT